MSSSSVAAAGWYPDPSGAPFRRWWDGAAWSSQTIPLADAPARPATPQAAPAPAYPASPASPPAYGSSAPSLPPYAASPYAAPAPAASAYAAPTQPAPTHPSAPLVPSYGTVVPYGAPGQVAQPYAQPYGAYGWKPVTPKPVVGGMGDAIKVVFANYATFEGRAGRPEYWYWYLFNSLLVIGAVLLIWVPGLNIALAFALIAWALTIIIPTLAVTVRRLRDAGLPWGLLFLQLVPYVGSIVLIILCAQRSKRP